MNGGPRVRVRQLSKQGLDGSFLLRPTDLTVDNGSSLAVLGRSGSGKSTLLSLLGLLDRPTQGAYELGGFDIGALSAHELDHLRSTQIGFVFQRFALFSHLSAIENVTAPLRHAGGRSEREMRAMAQASLEAVAMGAHAKRQPRQLSGGEQQRVAIARALVHGPKLILADEPTGALDELTGSGVVDLLLDRVMESGATLILVTHDSAIAARMENSMRLEGTSAGGQVS